MPYIICDGIVHHVFGLDKASQNNCFDILYKNISFTSHFFAKLCICTSIKCVSQSQQLRRELLDTFHLSCILQ